MKVLVTGGCGMIGFHVAKKYIEDGHDVYVMDNFERSELLGHAVDVKRKYFNHRELEKLPGKMTFWEQDVSKESSFIYLPDFDAIFHLAAQCGVPTSIANPRRDFEVNTIGTFNVLEHARRNKARVVYASTNKVYNLHSGWKLDERGKRWRWEDPNWYMNGFPKDGLTWTGPTSDLMGSRTPYGASKYAGDILCQEYYHMYGVPTGVFRMSCIFGDHQFGFEEQGWATWFVIATLKGLPITIYGDGRQVRDMLWVGNLVDAYDSFVAGKNVDHGVWNIGGGPTFGLSINECLDEIERITGKRSEITFKDWRPSDQRVYTSDLRDVIHDLKWLPTVSPEEGLRRIVEWVEPIKDLF